MTDREAEPFLRPGRALCARRRQCRRRRRPHRRPARLLGLQPRPRHERGRLWRPRSAGSKGPIMKVAQLMATIPDAAAARIRRPKLSKLQSRGAAHGLGLRQAPHGGRARAGLAEQIRRASSIIRRRPPRSARCTARPRMTAAAAGLQAAISRHAVGGRSGPAAAGADLFAIHRRMDPAIDTSEIAKEIGARIREELDYRREAKHARALPAHARGWRSRFACRGPWPELSTGRLLTLDWLEGRRLLGAQGRRAADPQPAWHGDVHGVVAAVQPLRRDPRRSASRQLHGVRRRTAGRGGINLLDYGCIRIFPPSVRRRCRRPLSTGLLQRRCDLIVHAYETWGFKRPEPRTDRYRSTSGRGSSTARCSTIGCARSGRRRQAVRIRPARKRFAGPPGAEAKGAGDACRASSCSWTAPRSGSAASSCTCVRSSIFTGCSARQIEISRSRRLPSSSRRSPDGRGLGEDPAA